MEQELCTHLPTEHTCWHWSWLNTDSLYYLNDKDAEQNFPSQNVLRISVKKIIKI